MFCSGFVIRTDFTVSCQLFRLEFKRSQNKLVSLFSFIIIIIIIIIIVIITIIIIIILSKEWAEK